MKSTKKQKKQILFLIFTMLFLLTATAVITSCGGDNTGNNDSTTNSQDNQQGAEANGQESEETPPEETYAYPELDGENADFKFLNPQNDWFYYTDIVHEEMTGDALDDAIYTRNRTIESKFNINIKEINATGTDMWAFNGEVRKIIMSGMDEYDAIFVPASFNGTVGSMIIDNFFYNLRDIPTIDLDGEWWNQTMIEEASIGTGEQIFYTGSGINLMTIQAVSCVYFNQDMMSTLGLDLPYNTVKEGKWTYDVFQEYIKAGTQLNGAADYKWDASGNTIYGLTSYEDSSTALLAGSGELFVTSDGKGSRPELAIGGERFVNALTKIMEILDPSNGNYLYANDSDNVFHYEPIFRNGRALMAIGELKAANVFRDMEATFGLLPIPKYEATQPAYYSHLFNQTPVLTIPVTNQRPDFTGAVLDAMAYLSNKDVVPVLFDVSVSQKQLRNEESIEMLDLIKNSGSFEISIAYGWTNTFYDLLRTKIGNGLPMDIASEIEKNIDKINTNIDKTMDAFN